MLFAAGFGTRMRPLTDNVPKPMIPVAGRPLIDHALDQTRAIAPDRIVANLHYKPDPLIAHLAGSSVETIIEAPDILDTGGGLRNALPSLGDAPVTTLNTDAIWKGPSPLALLHEAWDPARMDALLICVPLAQTHAYEGGGDFYEGGGDFALQETGRLHRGPGLVYGGAQIIKTNLLDGISQRAFSLNVLWDAMLTTGTLFGLRYPGHWCDVGHPDGIAVAEALLARDDV